MSHKLSLITTAVLGVIAGGVGYHLISSNLSVAAVIESMDSTVGPSVKYWVAPMDENYRRDKPGQSPMGMDLVPVYEEKNIESSSEKVIKHWVAPMDANFVRDEPGKSPMGMDLVPVYEDDNSVADSPGTVRISPSVVNNLGVKTGQVESGYLSTLIKTVGYVQFDPSQLSHVHSRVSGWIEKLYVEAEGDYIERGKRLFDLYSPELLNAQEELLLALDRGNRKLIEAAESRLKALQMPNFVIKGLKKDRKVRQTIPVYAQGNGIVGDLKISNGFYIKPDMTLLSISNLDKIWVEAEVFERQLQMVAEGDSAQLSTEAFPSKTWSGVVDYIYPILDPKTRTLKVRIELDNTDKLLKPNMYMQASINHEMTEKMLLIPREAVIRTGGTDRVVLDLGEGRFKSINVQTGRNSESSFEVLGGLVEGDSIVLAAQFLIDSESSKSSDFERMMPYSEAMQVDTPSMASDDTMIDHSTMNH